MMHLTALNMNVISYKLSTTPLYYLNILTIEIRGTRLT